MKPKIGKSTSRKELNARNGIYVSHRPISSFFKPLNTTKSSPINSSPVKTPTSSNTLRIEGPKKSLLTARKNGLTPVKLSFQFDFIKIPPVPVVSTSSSVCPPTPPLTPLTPLTQSPSTPKSQTSHQSHPSSVEAPLSPIKTPSSKWQKTDSLVTTHRKKRSTPKKKSPKKMTDLEEVIVISSSSDTEQSRHAKQSHPIVISSSDSDEVPEAKRRKISGHDDKITVCDPSIVLISEEKCGTFSVKQSVTTKQTEARPVKLYPASLKPSAAALTIPQCLLEKLETPPVEPDRLSEVLTVLWKRHTPYLTKDCSSPPKVRLFNAAQRTSLETYLDSECRYLSDKFAALAGYLTTVTTVTSMPRGENLATFFLLISDPKVSVGRLHSSVRDACVRYFPHLLHVHPPGSHRVVDTQYRVFLDVLTKGGQNLWERLQMLARFSGHCSRLLSFLVDLLLSDYWATLHSSSEPLFLRVFWTSKESPRINSSVRELLKELDNILQSFTASKYELLTLDSMCVLLYLCGTVCDNLSTELVSLCLSLPANGVHTLLERIHSLPLYLHLCRTLPTEKTCIVFVSDREIEQKNSKEIKHKEIVQNSKGSVPSSRNSVKPVCMMKAKRDVNAVHSTKEHSSESSHGLKKAANSTRSAPRISHDQYKLHCVQKRSALLKLKAVLPRRAMNKESATLKKCENCKHRTCMRCTKSSL